MDLDKRLDEVTQQFQDEVEQLRQLQTAADERREKKHSEAYDELVRVYLSDKAEGNKRQKLWTKILGTVASIIGVFASFVTYKLITVEPVTVTTKEAATQAAEKSAAISERMELVEERLDLNDEIHERMVDIQLRQQVQISESTDYLSDKLDRISSRARAVEEPPAVEEGRDIAKRIKEKQANENYDPADPLAGLK